MALKFYIVALGVFSDFKEESPSHPPVQMEANVNMVYVLMFILRNLMFSLIQLKSESEHLLAVCIHVITIIRRRLRIQGFM